MAKNREDQPVVLSKIYTRTGDDGTTNLGDMSRTGKTDPRLTAYADVDEANSAIGVAIAMGDLPEELVTLLIRIQNDLFDVGADLCTPVVEDPEFPPLRVTDDYVERLEADCDTHNEGLPTLRSFILPGGTRGAALLHVARTVGAARRTLDVGRPGGARGHEPADGALPQPPVGPAVHPRPHRQRRQGRRALEAGRRALGHRRRAGRGGFEPGEEAGQGGAAHRELDHAAVVLDLHYAGVRLEGGLFLGLGLAASGHDQTPAVYDPPGSDSQTEDREPQELVTAVTADAEPPYTTALRLAQAAFDGAPAALQ